MSKAKLARKLVSDSYDDKDMSDSSDNASEFEDAQNVEDGKNNDYVSELEERQKYVQEFINKSFQHFKKSQEKSLDFGYIHDQDMNYYQERYSYNVDDRPMLGPIEDDLQEAASNDGPDYDPDYDEEVNRLLDEVDKEILQDHSNSPTYDDGKLTNGENYTDPKREQYEDYYDEFPEDIHHVGPIPNWYKKMLQTKIKETRSRLENLSNLVCYACASTGAHIKRIEQDHSTTFCKMDETRHPPLDKPWTNFWKFNCMIKCKEIDKPNHAHTADCESVLLEHVNTGVSTETKNISQNEYPNFVMNAVELFQDFAIETTKNVPFLDSKEATDTVYEKPMWTEMKLRSNYKNELMIVVRGKGVTSLITKLRRYFDSGPGRTSNVISVFCINQKWSQKKSNFLPSHVCGSLQLKDKVGPISINYEPKTNVNFNSVEAIQLGKIIEDYAGLTRETTLLDIGCNFGVLSLMMAHKCDRVIGLNTMHFASSEISQAEELKKFNNLHNVSFVGCDPKDVLTKCSSIIKRTITVAVLNLASPYGKSIHVMQALRDLPTIWRVIIYGSFTKEFHRNISMLTSKDDLMGDHYLPMQGCILDKSPSIENAFDIVILFERKSLVTPSIELLAPGPTLNIKSDTDSYGSLDGKETKPIIKLEKGFGKPDFRPKKFFGPKPFKYRGQINRFGKFDSPMLPMDKEQTPENSQKKPNERSKSPPAVERKFDCSVLRQKPPPAPPAQNGKGKAVYPSIRNDLQAKELLKRTFDSPYLPISKEEKPATNINRSPTSSAKEKSFDCSVLRKEKQFDCSVLRKQEQSGNKRSPLPCPSLSIKKEFQKFKCPSPPRERYPSPPPPPPTDNFPDASQIKKEKDADYSPLTTVKAEPMELCEDKEEGELSPEDDGIPRVPSKSKTPDPSYFVGFSEANCQNIPQSVIVKSEPADFNKTPDLPPCCVKTEPEDMQISPYSQDIENMETPIHNCKALSDSSSLLPVATNFTTLDGYKFSVKANQSFLPFKRDPDATEQPNVAIKTEPALDTDEEIKIISEKKIAAQPSQQQQSSEPKIRVRTVDEIIKTKNEPAVANDDLRALIEQRKMIQRKLDRERETRCYKDLHGRSPSPDLPQRYRRQMSPSPPPPFKKYNRSPSPPPPFRKYNRSPSPPATFRKYNRSPSPPSNKYNRSLSPYRRRSPISSRRYKRSPPSPVRSWIKRERSRSRSPSIKRSRRSPPPSERRSRRSPSPIRFKREPFSPVRAKREPLSPMSTRWGERSRRSPSSSSSHKSYNKSPVKSRHDRRRRRSKSRSPAEVKSNRVSMSPITLSPSVSPSPPKKRDGSKERDSLKKKKKKTKSKSKSKSPSRASKKKSKTIKDESHWDIPVLSTLSSTPNISEQVNASNVEAATESVPSEPTESVKQEPATSRSKSRSPIPQSEDVKAEVTAE